MHPSVLLSLFSTLLPSLVFALTPVAWETSQHTPVLFYQTTTVPMVTIHVGFKAGSAFDDKQFGLAALTTAMLNQGNHGESSTHIAEQFADTGAIYASNTTRDMIALTLNTLTEPRAFKQATDTFSEVITHPDFPASAFRQQQDQQLATLLSEKESPNTLAINTFFNTLYHDHPYGHTVYGTEASVKTLSLQDLHTFYQRYFVPENAVMVIVGNLSSKDAHILAEKILRDLPQGKPAPDVPKLTPQAIYPAVNLPFPASQTALCLGQLGINHQSPNYFPLMVGNYTLGGGMLVSRLAKEIREKRGLTYGITSNFMPMPGPGPFVITLSTKANQAPTALHVTEQILSDFIHTGPTAQELAAAKQYMTGSFPLALASNSDIANTLLRIAFYHLPHDYLETYTTQINAVTQAQIKAAFEQTLSPKNMLVVSIGQLK